MNKDKDNIKQAMHNAEVISNAVIEQKNLHEKLKAEGKSPEYILAHGQGYAEGVYDTKTELQPKISDLKEELETYKTLVDKYGGVEQLEKYLVEISQALGNVTICSAKTVIEDKNEVIRCLKEELETYEKIAKRLAKEILSIHNPMFNMVTVNNMEILIENARNEVEKDER